MPLSMPRTNGPSITVGGTEIYTSLKPYYIKENALPPREGRGGPGCSRRHPDAEPEPARPGVNRSERGRCRPAITPRPS